MADEKKSVFDSINDMSRKKKIQAIIASLLSVFLAVAIPAYAWFNYQREIARVERIKSPDMLYITAANREDKINIDMNNIDTNAIWNSESSEKATYSYFVFAVAGQYVTSYNLQLAHTKNNKYTYEIFEADASNTNPHSEDASKIEGKDFIKYEPDNNRISVDLSDVTTHSGIDTSKPIYYSVKQDRSTPPKEISLNNGTYVVTPAVAADPSNGVEASAAVTKSYNGHYINVTGTPDFNTLANNDDYKAKTYNYDRVDVHSAPLYWQCTNIPVEDVGNARDPFYHEYILKVSWDPNNLGSLVSKDTDIVYITVSVK